MESYLAGARARAVAQIAASRMYFDKKTVENIDVRNRTVLVRVDFNVPLAEGRVADDSRIRAAIPTINYLRAHQAKIILCSHLGRPQGQPQPEFSLKPAAARLAEILDKQIIMADTTVGEDARQKASALKNGQILLLENLRFNPGESADDPAFAKELAAMADVYVNDAFGAAHRSHASTVGVTHYLPSVAGLLLEKEVSILRKLIEAPNRPFLACLGGNKISDKIGVITRFLDMVDGIIAGGGMCFTFLKAKGYDVGKSLVETDQIDLAKEIMAKARQNQVSLYLPSDIVAAPEISGDASYRVVPAKAVPADWLGLDIGPQTIEIYSQALESAKTIFWNGPMGVFEIPQFAHGTKAVAQAIGDATRNGSLTIIGGGDSLAALKKFKLENDVSFASTGGGASLKILEGTPLPGVEALEDR